MKLEGAVDPHAKDAALSEAPVAYAGKAGLHGTARSAALGGVVVPIIDLAVATGTVLRRWRG